MKNVKIIAEAGVNHNGNFELAKRLVAAAADAGADFIKFQTFKTENLVSKSAHKASYQKKNTDDGDNLQYQMLKKLEMPFEWHYELMDYAETCNIKFLSTGFDEESIDFLANLGIELIKIPSGEITNKPYLKQVARKKLPVVLSTGMATLKEIEAAMQVLIQEGMDKPNITILHCNTEYPTPMKDVNLKAMNYIGNELGVAVGYSDHTLGIEVPIAAVALGATFIEKHFTLDRTMIGPDHIASLEPQELKNMVHAIRNIELSISGNGVKEPSESEIKNVNLVRKSLHFKFNLPKGHIVKERDLIALRPGTGINPMEIENYIGRKLSENVGEFAMVRNNQFS